MANSWFAFKQFRIEQGACGMKVSTDACIQGAWSPVPAGAVRILDLGTGTGLLSLMLAQRAPLATIDALEIEAAAAAQAAGNTRQSPFAGRIQVHQADARCWVPEQPYDLVICNPPFFNDSLSSPDAARNRARHNDTLRQADLVSCLERLLRHDGDAAVLLPLREDTALRTLMARQGWTARHALSVKDHPAADVKRRITVYRRGSHREISELLTIKNADGTYTAAFGALLRPFYLHL